MTHETQQAPRLAASYRWVMLLVAFFAIFTYHLTLQSVPPVLSLIIEEFRLTHAQAGLIMSAFALSGIFLAIPAGLIVDRYGPKRVAVVSYCLAIAGVVVVAFSPSLILLLVGRVFTGVGAITLMLLAPQFISRWFLGRELGLSLSLLNMGMPIAVITSFPLFGGLAEGVGWRAPILLSAMAGVVGLFLFMLFYRPLPFFQGQPAPPINFSLRTGHRIWLLGISWMCVNASLLSFLTFAPDYFLTQGLPLGRAGFMSSIVMWGLLFLIPLVGFMLDRGLERRLMIRLGAVGIAVVLFSFPTSASWALPLLILLAILASLPPTAIFSFPPFLLAPERLGLGFGILAAFGQLGTVLGPLSVGTARDLGGSYVPGFWVMSAFAVLMALVTFALPPGKGTKRIEAK